MSATHSALLLRGARHGFGIAGGVRRARREGASWLRQRPAVKGRDPADVATHRVDGVDVGASGKRLFDDVLLAFRGGLEEKSRRASGEAASHR